MMCFMHTIMSISFIQIVKAFTERQKLSAAAERVLESADEGSEAKGFLTHMLCTGHRLATWICVCTRCKDTSWLQVHRYC